jgi:hypothetical protein
MIAGSRPRTTDCGEGKQVFGQPCFPVKGRCAIPATPDECSFPPLPVEVVPLDHDRLASRLAPDANAGLADRYGPDLAALLVSDFDRDGPLAEADPPVSLHVNVRVPRRHSTAEGRKPLKLPG